MKRPTGEPSDLKPLFKAVMKKVKPGKKTEVFLVPKDATQKQGLV